MEYDPVKDKLGKVFGKAPVLQRIFFAALGAIFLRNWYVRRALRQVVGRFDSGTKVSVLDAGTGFGQHAYWIARKFPNTTITAVDVKEEYLAKARSFIVAQELQNRVTFKVDDLTDLGVDGPFDVILSVDVMEHIEDDRAVFRNFNRVLSDRGVVLVNTPSDQGGSDVSDESDESFIGEHVRDGYPLDELTGKLGDAGLEAFKSTYTYGRWGGIAWRLLVKYPILMLDRSMLFALVLPFYYLPVFPIGMVLNAIDLARENVSGTGLLVEARRASAAHSAHSS